MNRLLVLMTLYGAASLLHFAHNAIFLKQYPNLPSWLTAGGVWAAWCGVMAVGVLGYVFYRRVSKPVGLLIIALYAALGFAGLDHYVVAPVSAHSVAMNATILVEVIAAAVLLIAVAKAFSQRFRSEFQP